MDHQRRASTGPLPKIAAMGFATLCLSANLLAEPPLPDPATGGKEGGPLCVLMLKGQVQIGFGQQPPLDPIYLKHLDKLGFRVVEARDFQPLTRDYLRQFNCVVYINPSPYASGAYFDPASWQGGMHMLTVRKNVSLLHDYAKGGGGVLFVPAVEECGMRWIASHKELLAPYGLEPECAQVRDLKHAFLVDKVINAVPLHYSWTEAIAKHPATEGVKRIYYPTHVMRWDDNYTTIPLFPRDEAWTVLARGMPSSVSGWSNSSIYDPNLAYPTAKGWEAPPIAVCREYEKGRVAAIGINHFHLFYFAYAKGPHANGKGFWEDYFGPTDGMIAEKGDGKTPSDCWRLLDNLYRWLSVPAGTSAMGGYDPEKGVKIPPIPEPLVPNVSAVWAGHDPMVTGPIRPMRVLVGARTSLSDGKGTVAECASAAKAAGYDVVCFTETFERLQPEDWPAFVAECGRLSDAETVLVPGVDSEDALGNRFLLVGLRWYPRHHLLDETGKKLVRTGHMTLGVGEVMPIGARPGHMAKVREKGCLPHDLYSHTIGFAVATYRDGKQVDDGRPAYEWQLFNASHPVPVAVHEVYSPDAVASAARTGLQNFVNSDTPANAAFYYHQGTACFGGNPTRHYLSSGPLIDSCGMDDWQSPHWRVTLKAHGEAPITEVRVRDQRDLYRRFAPNTKQIELGWSGDLGAQHWFLVELRDAAGGRALLGGIRTLPERSFVRCGDRQNWFGGLHATVLNYTGRMRCLPSRGPRANLSFPGVELPHHLCPRLQLPYNGPGWTITEYAISHTYVPGAPVPGTDSYPIFNAMPLGPFAGKIRYRMLPFIPGKGRVTPSFIAVEVTATLKANLEPEGKLWPIIGSYGGEPKYLYTDPATGDRVEGTLEKEGFIDLPSGGAIGNVLALSPLRASGNGRIGLPAPDDGRELPAGTTFSGAFAAIRPDQAAGIRQSMGFDGPTPYTIEIARGKLERVAMHVVLSARDHGVSGRVKGATIPHWWVGTNDIPLLMKGANPAWPIGLWRSDTGAIQSFGVFEGEALGRLDVTKDCDFYFGNLLTASAPELRLAFVSDWTQEGATIEVHNPTDRPMRARIRSTKAIRGRRRIKWSGKIAPGTSLLVQVP